MNPKTQFTWEGVWDGSNLFSAFYRNTRRMLMTSTMGTARNTWLHLWWCRFLRSKHYPNKTHMWILWSNTGKGSIKQSMKHCHLEKRYRNRITMNFLQQSLGSTLTSNNGTESQEHIPGPVESAIGFHSIQVQVRIHLSQKVRGTSSLLLKTLDFPKFHCIDQQACTKDTRSRSGCPPKPKDTPTGAYPILKLSEELHRRKVWDELLEYRI